MKQTLIQQKSNAIKIAFCAFLLLTAAGCTISGVNADIFNNGGNPLHPCGIAIGQVVTRGNNLPDGPVAVTTYEGDSNPGYVYVWKSCRAFLSSAPLTNRGRVINTPTTNPDYEITGITDPEGVAFDYHGNLYISSTSPTPTNIYYINMANLAAQAQPDPTTHIPTLSASALKTIAMPANPINNPAYPNDIYGQPRALTYDSDDSSLYVVMENHTRGNNTQGTILQITGPATGSPKIYPVGDNLQNLGTNCLGLAYSHKHQCFFMTSLFNYLHQFSFPSGTTVTTGVNFQEPIAPIKLQQYLFDVGVSADPTSQDSVFFTTSNALTSSGALSNTKPECYLNSIAYKNWSGYAGGTSPTLTTLDPPLFSNNNYVCWGVAVFPYSNADGHTSFHAIIAADAPKTKVLRFLEQ